MTDIQSEARRIIGTALMVTDEHRQEAYKAAVALGVPTMTMLFAISRQAAEVLESTQDDALRARISQLIAKSHEASRRERSANGFGSGHRVGNHYKRARRIGMGDQAKVKRIQSEVRVFRKELEILERELKRRAHA